MLPPHHGYWTGTVTVTALRTRGAPAHRISLGKKGAEKGRSGSEEREAFQNREGWEG